MKKYRTAVPGVYTTKIADCRRRYSDAKPETQSEFAKLVYDCCDEVLAVMQTEMYVDEPAGSGCGYAFTEDGQDEVYQIISDALWTRAKFNKDGDFVTEEEIIEKENSMKPYRFIVIRKDPELGEENEVKQGTALAPTDDQVRDVVIMKLTKDLKDFDLKTDTITIRAF